jgi:hypothetical protein
MGTALSAYRTSSSLLWPKVRPGEDFTQYLCPSGLCVISCEDFQQGIMVTRNGDPDSQLYSVAPAQDEDPLPVLISLMS